MFEVIYEISFKTVIYEFSVWIAAKSQEEALKLAETRPEIYMPTAFKEVSKPKEKAKAPAKAKAEKPAAKAETDMAAIIAKEIAKALKAIKK
jgi:hypothetical protein